jgi:hypothetical protein
MRWSGCPVSGAPTAAAEAPKANASSRCSATRAIDPARCRGVKAWFSVDRMAADYASIYRQVLSSPEPVAGSEPTVAAVRRHRRMHAVAVPDPGQNRRTS